MKVFKEKKLVIRKYSEKIGIRNIKDSRENFFDRKSAKI